MKRKRHYAKGPASFMAVLAPALCAPGMVTAAEVTAEIVARQDAGDTEATPTSSASTKSGKPLRFRAETLRARGLPEDLAEFFAAGPRFLPGTQLVYVSVNGASPKRLEARFDSEGQLCLNAPLLAQLGLRVPAEQTGEGCRDFLDAFPETRIKPRPGAVRVDLVVPEEAIDPAAFGNGYLRDGAAAMLNYNVSAYQSRSKTSTMNSAYGQFQPGVNLGNWVLRSNEYYYKSDKRSTFTHQQAYAGRTIEPLKSMLQVGQLQSVGQGFGGLPMIGAQLFSDSAQNSAAQLNTPIQGVAHTRALVEVRQRGQLIYQTVVAPGSFTLDNVGRINSGADVEVEVIEEDGRREKFVIAAGTGFNNPNQSTSFGISAGRYRNLYGDFGNGEGFV
jgi:outer membrane usher protein